jgi:hypothetical protein
MRRKRHWHNMHNVSMHSPITVFYRYKNNQRNNSRYGPPLRTEYRLVIENLSSRVSWQVSRTTMFILLYILKKKIAIRSDRQLQKKM